MMTATEQQREQAYRDLLPDEESYALLLYRHPEMVADITAVLARVVREGPSRDGAEIPAPADDEASFRWMALLLGLVAVGGETLPSAAFVRQVREARELSMGQNRLEEIMDRVGSRIVGGYRPARNALQAWMTVERMREIETILAARTGYGAAMNAAGRMVRKTRGEVAVVCNYVHRIVADCAMRLKRAEDDARRSELDHAAYLESLRRDHSEVFSAWYRREAEWRTAVSGREESVGTPDTVPRIPMPVISTRASSVDDPTGSIRRLVRLSELAGNGAVLNSIVATAEDLDPSTFLSPTRRDLSDPSSIAEENIPVPPDTLAEDPIDGLKDEAVLPETRPYLRENHWDELFFGPHSAFDGDLDADATATTIEARTEFSRNVPSSEAWFRSCLVQPPEVGDGAEQRRLDELFMDVDAVVSRYRRTYPEFLVEASGGRAQKTGIYDGDRSTYDGETRRFVSTLVGHTSGRKRKTDARHGLYPGTLSEYAFRNSNRIDPESEMARNLKGEALRIARRYRPIPNVVVVSDTISEKRRPLPIPPMLAEAIGRRQFLPPINLDPTPSLGREDSATTPETKMVEVKEVRAVFE